MQIRVRRDFFDKEHDLALRKMGEILEVSENRGNQLVRMNLAEPIPEKKETKKAAAE